MLALWKKSYDKPRQRIKKERYCFADKGLSPPSLRAEGLLFLYGLESNPESSLQLHRRLDSLEAMRLISPPNKIKEI